MKISRVLAGSLLVVSTLVAGQTKVYEYPRAESLPEDDTAVFQRDPALLSSQDLHMSGERFLNAWTSKTNERERIKADLYLQGVLDTTEGTVWCGYNRLKTTSIHEVVYSYFSHLSPQRLQQTRATVLILEAMTQQGTGHCPRKKP
ncbi:Rap1a/Tai family immunity protein [Kosakonia sp.]|uniref:Rap1a/Tai family immunity protein n=1 Tax=Kosakonia sp. TaxID=1916651 RepID=UPI00289B58C2|nr:Rap1a/Tai family immunity protein [Kosakonia sp.]